MSNNSPWSVKGINADTRKAVKVAAKEAGQTVGQWLTEAILVSASAQLRNAEEAPAKTADGPPAARKLPDNMAAAIAELTSELRALREGGSAGGQNGERPVLAPLEHRISQLEGQISELADAIEAAMLPPRHLEPWEKESHLGFGALPDADDAAEDAGDAGDPLPEFAEEPVEIEQPDAGLNMADKERRLRGLLARFLDS
jgi:hypothetical protein